MVNQVSLSGSQPILAAAPAPRPAPLRPASPAGTDRTASGGEADAAAQVGRHLEQSQAELKLQVDAGSGRTIFRVVQQGTGEVVMQIPSDEILGMSRRLREAEGQALVPGTLLDRQG